MSRKITTKKELKDAFKESVREIIAQEMTSLKALILPYISDKEQTDIEKRYGKPSRKIARSKMAKFYD